MSLAIEASDDTFLYKRKLLIMISTIRKASDKYFSIGLAQKG